ncbi:MAG: hypothetical protein ACRDKK_04040 [Gaiellaceae bacterium]
MTTRSRASQRRRSILTRLTQGPEPGEERAYRIMRWAWVPLIVIVLLILIALVR